MSKKHKYFFKCPMFDFKVILVLQDRELLKPYGIADKPDQDWYRGELWQDTDGRFIVWVADPADYYTMVHEALHLATKILDRLGIIYTGDNDEILAHYQNYWVQQFWHKMPPFAGKEK